MLQKTRRSHVALDLRECLGLMPRNSSPYPLRSTLSTSPWNYLWISGSVRGSYNGGRRMHLTPDSALRTQLKKREEGRQDRGKMRLALGGCSTSASREVCKTHSGPRQPVVTSHPASCQTVATLSQHFKSRRGHTQPTGHYKPSIIVLQCDCMQPMQLCTYV